MPRPRRCRRICTEPAYDSFVPQGVPGGETVNLTMDEYEAIRLIDLNKCTHEQCARQMDISRTTVTELYEKARYKIADCVVNGKPLLIAGGDYRLCDGTADFCCQRMCIRTDQETGQTQKIQKKGEKAMRIAVTYENGKVFQHFGHTEEFKFYDVEDDRITETQVVNTNGQGHGALAGFLTSAGVNILVCGGIGGGAQNALSEAGIQLFGGVTGDADQAVQDYLDGKLLYNPNVMCSPHDHEHGEGQTCGEHGCGKH